MCCGKRYDMEDVMETPELPKLDSFMPSKADMTHCPLCLDKFTMFEEPGKEGHVYFVCHKPKCMISIWVRDPMLGRWGRVESEPCPLCSEPKMRLFFRTDQYLKMLCVKCGYICENVDPDKHAALMKAEEDRGFRFTPKPLPPTKET